MFNKSIFYKKQVAVFSAGIIAICFFSSCKKKTNTTSTNQPLPATVSFSKDITPIFSGNCSISGCHTGSSPAAGLNLSANVAYSQLFNKHEVDTVNATSSVLYIEINSGSMPQSGRLSDYDVNVVLKWIQQKSKNN